LPLNDFRVRLLFAPTDQIPDTGYGEGGSETRIEGRKELHRHTRYELQTDSQTHEKENHYITTQVKEGEERFLAFREVENAGSVTLDEIGYQGSSKTR